MKDKLSEERLEKLHPKVRDTFRGFIEDCEEGLGITLRITQGLRTIAQQDALYAQGRTKPGKMITNAKGGTSFHNYGLAVDLAVLVARKDLRSAKEVFDVDWGFDMARMKPFAKKYGIEWGGDWTSLKDFPHFQVSFGHPVKHLLACVKEKKVDDEGYVVV